MMGVGMVSLPPHDPLLSLSMTAWQSWKFPCLEKWSPLPIFRYMETRKLVCNAQWPEKILSLLNNLLNFFINPWTLLDLTNGKFQYFVHVNWDLNFFKRVYTYSLLLIIGFWMECLFPGVHFLDHPLFIDPP